MERVGAWVQPCAVVGRGGKKNQYGKRERVAPHLANRETIGKIGMGEGRMGLWRALHDRGRRLSGFSVELFLGHGLDGWVHLFRLVGLLDGHVVCDGRDSIE